MTWTPKRIGAKFLLDPRVETLISVFVNAGEGEAMRFVGGCVRNELMNLPCSDIDVATTLTPDRVKEIFEAAGHNVHPTGLEHGTVTVAIKGEPFEITTLRRDVETDGRRAVIEFSTDWREDAERRDFRCNAIYMDAMGYLFDPVGGGIEDAMNRRLIFVGDAEQRIREDYLRVLRLFRFQATLGATGDDVGLEACRKLATGITTLSGERIEKEMMKLMASVDPVPSVKSMVDTGVYDFIISGQRPDLRVLGHTVRATKDPVVRLAALFDYNDTAADETMNHWKSSGDLRRQVRGAIVPLPNVMESDLKAIIYKVGFPAFRDRLILSWANSFATSVDDLNAMLARLEADVPVFPIKGQDIVDAGQAPGKAVGVILKDVESWWVETGYPDREACLARIQFSVGENA